MRLSFLFRGVVALILWWSSIVAAHASHILGAELTYKYIGTAASPNQYHVTARLFRDLASAVADPQLTLTCGKNECGTTLPGSFTTTLVRTGTITPPASCANASIAYQIVTLEGAVQLSPAHWTLSIDCSNRAVGVTNISFSETFSTYVKAELDNTTGLINSSPHFTTSRLIQLAGNQSQRYSLSAFDSEGDSLVYQLVQPLATPTTSAPCGGTTNGTLAPHFQINAATGELLTVAGPVQQGRYVLAARVDEFRRVAGSWQQIGSITRDMTYFVAVGTNQVPSFTRVSPTGSPGSQLLGQTIRVNPGQTLSLTLTATDPDAGQLLTMSSEIAAIIPGATFQDLGNGQGQITWAVPITLPLGRYAFTAMVADNSCPAPGVEVVTLRFLVTQQVLATRPRQPLAQLPYPTPFSDEVRLQFTGSGSQAVLIADELGRTVARLTTAPDGSIVWRPAANLSAGLYFARNQSGTQVARLPYSGH